MGAFQAHRQALVFAVIVLVAGTSVWLLHAQATDRVVQAGFWFEPVSFDDSEVEAGRLGGGMTPQELETVKAVAMAELRHAYAGFRISFSERRNATFNVRVAQTLQHPVFKRAMLAGESRGVWPFGGQGAVNFRLLASTAIAYAPPGADRAMRIEAIGRGVGRSAAHEFAHQILGSLDVHHAAARNSYEYSSADRAEQYYGPMYWDTAGPMLARRLGTTVSSSR